jgi:hypothetical protein
MNRNGMAIIEGGSTIWARQTIESEIFFSKPHSWFKVWFYVVSKASHKDGKRFKRGECFVQYQTISDVTGVSYDAVKKCMVWLRKTGAIRTSRSIRGVNIFVTNYSHYQNLDNYSYATQAPTVTPEKHHKSTKTAPDQHSDKQECNNDNNVKNETNIITGPSGGINIFDSVTISGDEYSGDEIVDSALALFENTLPGDFVGKKSAYYKKPTRDAVAALLKRYDLLKLEDLIWAYNETIGDPYRPQVGTVYEFCTSKLAKIESFIEGAQVGIPPNRRNPRYSNLTFTPELLESMSEEERNGYLNYLSTGGDNYR